MSSIETGGASILRAVLDGRSKPESLLAEWAAHSRNARSVEIARIQPRSDNWVERVTSNPPIAEALSRRGPMDVMISGACRIVRRLDSLSAVEFAFQVDGLVEEAIYSGILNTDSSFFFASARMEARHYLLRTSSVFKILSLLRRNGSKTGAGRGRP